MPGVKYNTATYARLLGIRVAMYVPLRMAAIEMTPSTHPSSVVCRFVKLKDVTMIVRWLASEEGIFETAPYRAKIHVLRSRSASIILEWMQLNTPYQMVAERRTRTGAS